MSRWALRGALAIVALAAAFTVALHVVDEALERAWGER